MADAFDGSFFLALDSDAGGDGSGDARMLTTRLDHRLRSNYRWIFEEGYTVGSPWWTPTNDLTSYIDRPITTGAGGLIYSTIALVPMWVHPDDDSITIRALAAIRRDAGAVQTASVSVLLRLIGTSLSVREDWSATAGDHFRHHEITLDLSGITQPRWYPLAIEINGFEGSDEYDGTTYTLEGEDYYRLRTVAAAGAGIMDETINAIAQGTVDINTETQPVEPYSFEALHVDNDGSDDTFFMHPQEANRVPDSRDAIFYYTSYALIRSMSMEVRRDAADARTVIMQTSPQIRAQRAVEGTDSAPHALNSNAIYDLRRCIQWGIRGEGPPAEALGWISSYVRRWPRVTGDTVNAKTLVDQTSVMVQTDNPTIEIYLFVIPTHLVEGQLYRDDEKLTDNSASAQWEATVEVMQLDAGGTWQVRGTTTVDIGDSTLNGLQHLPADAVARQPFLRQTGIALNGDSSSSRYAFTTREGQLYKPDIDLIQVLSARVDTEALDKTRPARVRVKFLLLGAEYEILENPSGDSRDDPEHLAITLVGQSMWEVPR